MIINLFPKDLNDYTTVTSLGGGTASTYQLKNEKTGHSVVLKYGAHADAMKIEILTNFLYQALGVPVPRVQIYRELPPLLASELKLPSHMGIFQVSEYIVPHHHDNHCALIAQKNSQFFMAHILLGNIDITKDDNFVMNAQGEVYCIDAGANFIFRPLGGERKDDPSFISELDIFTSIAERSKNWFTQVDQDAIKAQIRAIIEKQNEIETVLWEVATQLELADELRIKYIQCFTDRLDQLITRFCPDEYYAKVDKKAHSDETAAGVFTYAFIENQPHVLLSKRVRHQWWDNFGGKSDKEDTWLYQTAAREVFEESSGILNYSERELLTHPSHDLITQKDNHSFTYRLYFIEHDYVDLQSMMQHGEHTDYRWVPLEGMVRGLQEQQIIFEENEQTIQIDFATGKTKEKLILYPPLYRMLQQTSVQDHLENLLSTGRLIPSHTQSVNGVASSHKRKRSRIKAPRLMRLQIAEMAINYSEVIRACKQKFLGRSEPSNDSITPMEIDYIPPSEWHLQAVLGREYQKNKLAANVRKMVETKLADTKNLTFEQREQLITQCIRLIEIEKQYPDRVYFYHACDAKVAFAYEVYSIMQQILHQENHWFAFRASNAHVKKFANIQAFIDHYSEHGTKEIDNNEKDYHESVISTNVFLFGNHEQPTSCSVNLRTRRDINLRALLMDLFQPFARSVEATDVLIRLFEQHACQHGMLFQIGVAKDHVSGMAYPAGQRGMFNPYHEQKDLITILEMLSAEMASAQVPANVIDYIFKLQARLLVPPHYPFSVQSVQLHEGNDINPAILQTKLNKCIENILYTMLTDLNMVNIDFFHEETSLFRALLSVYQSNTLSYIEKISESLLVKAIKQNDERLVRYILAQFPNLIFKPITYYTGYIGSFQSSITGMPLEIIVFHSQLSGELLEDFFGDHWLELLPGQSIGDIDHLICVLEKTPKEKCLNNAICYRDVIKNGEHLVKVLKLLDPNHCLDFARENQDKIQDGYELARVLKQLDFNYRLDFAKANQNKIQHGKELAKVLEQLDFNYRLDFAKANQDKIQDGDQLLAVLNELDPKDHLGFAQANQDKIKYGYELAKILKLLSPNLRLDFARANQDKIQDSDQLLAVLSELDPKDRLNFAKANQNKIQNINEFIPILKGLDSQDRLDFARANQNKIQNINEFILILKGLDSQDRLDFARENQTKIQNGDQLLAVLSELDSQDRLDFARENQTKIQCGYELARVLKQLDSNHRLSFARANQDKIQNGNELAAVLGSLDLEYRLDFAQANQSKIQNGDELAAVLGSLDLEYRLDFAQANQDKVKSGGGIGKILQCLNKNDRLAYAKDNQGKIDNGYDLGKIIEQLYITDQIHFIENNLNKIHDVYEITYIMDRLGLSLEGKSNKLSFTKIIQNKLKSGSDVAVIVRDLPSSEQLHFVLENQDKIVSIYDVTSILQPLEINNKLIFIEIHKDKIKNKQAFCCVLALLKKASASIRLNLAQAHLDKIENGLDLAEVIQHLDVNDRFGFAQANQSKIQNGNELSKVLEQMQHLSESDQLSFALANQNKINASELVDVLTFLKGDACLNFANASQHLINSNKLYEILKKLVQISMKDALTFALANRDKIESCFDFACMLDCFKNGYELIFVRANQDKIINGLWLEVILIKLRFLPDKDRLSVAKDNQDKIKDGYELAKIIKELPMNASLNFAQDNQDKIQNAHQLFIVLRGFASFNREMRLNFTLANLDKIKNKDQVFYHIIKILDEKDRSVFEQAWQNKQLKENNSSLTAGMVDSLTLFSPKLPEKNDASHSLFYKQN